MRKHGIDVSRHQGEIHRTKLEISEKMEKNTND